MQLSAVEILVDDLEKIFDHGNDIAEEDRETYLCINKMLAYLFSWHICHINDCIMKDYNKNNTGKVHLFFIIFVYIVMLHDTKIQRNWFLFLQNKKTAKASIETEWEQSGSKALELLYRWLQVPLYKIWRPPIVENSFVM